MKFLFLKRTLGDTFIYPDIQDTDNVAKADIEMVLPKPTATGNTERSCSVLTFPKISFGKYNMG